MRSLRRLDSTIFARSDDYYRGLSSSQEIGRVARGSIEIAESALWRGPFVSATGSGDDEECKSSGARVITGSL